MPEKNRNVIDLHGRPRETREQALERLFMRHRAALRGFLSVRLGVHEDLDDVVQEVFARIARMEDLLDKLPPENGKARSFIFAAANHLVVDLERRKSVRRQYRDDQVLAAESGQNPAEPSPEVIVLAREELGLVKGAIATMKPDWRKAFILNRFKQRSYQEIADEMEISLKTVEKYIGKALLHLRNTVLDTWGAGR